MTLLPVHRQAIDQATAPMREKSSLRRKSSGGGETDLETELSGSEELVDILLKQGIAREGNGEDQELSKMQLNLVFELYERVSGLRGALPPEETGTGGWCDYETCRRYIVARSWNIDKAEEQLKNTLMWRAKNKPGSKEFWQASKCFENPLALSMRIVGWTPDGRPIGYTRFSEAHDRWDVPGNMEHIMLLLEAASKLIRERREKELNETAASRQCVWVVDFDGFAFRDQNPKTAILTAALLEHYPEMLNLIVLLDAPLIFNGLWTLVAPLLDDRVRRKIMFVKGKQADTVLRERLGSEAALWIAEETKDSAEKKNRKGEWKKYWIPPTQEGDHDARGFPSYVDSDLYIKTSGDAFEEIRQGKLKQNEKQKAKVNEARQQIQSTIPVQPSFTKLIYSGTF